MTPFKVRGTEGLAERPLTRLTFSATTKDGYLHLRMDEVDKRSDNHDMLYRSAMVRSMLSRKLIVLTLSQIQTWSANKVSLWYCPGLTNFQLQQE